MPSLVETGQVVLEKKIKMLKVYDSDDNNNDNDERQQKILNRNAHEPMAKK